MRTDVRPYSMSGVAAREIRSLSGMTGRSARAREVRTTDKERWGMGEIVRMTNSSTGGPVFVYVQGREDRPDHPDGLRRLRRRRVVEDRGQGQDLHPAAQDHVLGLHRRLQVHDLLRQAHHVPHDPRGLRSQRRAQHPEPRHLRLRAHLLGRGHRHPGERDQPGQARSRPGRHPVQPQLPPHVGQRGLPPQHLLPLHEHDGLHLCRPQPRQLGRLALGRHAHVGLQLAPGQPRAVRPVRGHPARTPR